MAGRRIQRHSSTPVVYVGALACLWALFASAALLAQSGYVPPQKLDPNAGSPALDADFDREAWFVYTYEVDTGGNVVDATIHSSNDIPEADQHMLAEIEAQKFEPATRNGKPIEAPVGPVVYTWILDIPREMSEAFSATYEQAWDHFRAEDYDKAFDLAAQLKETPGRNAYEEVKFQILAASIAARWDDPTSEMQHLKRVVELQTLADRNQFRHPYVEPDHYALILERIHTLLLQNNQLADAQDDFNRIMMRGTEEAVTQRVQAAQQAAQDKLQDQPVVAMGGELSPLYEGAPGMWEVRLFRDSFRIAQVRGSVDWLYLVCQGKEKRLPYPSSSPWVVPQGWQECKVEVSGRAGTRFEIEQLSPSAR